MSRIGKLPISIPAGVTVTVQGNKINVKGPRGLLSQAFRSEVSVAVVENQIIVTRRSDHRKDRAFHGLYRALIANMVRGVSVGFSKTLEIVGTGYRAAKEKIAGEDCIVFKKGELGFSHPIYFAVPSGILAEVQDRTKIVLTGNDKNLVGLVAAKIRDLRPPDPYKGKGIRYLNEKVRLKPGKSGA